MLRTKFIVLLLIVMAMAMLFVTLNPQFVPVELAWMRWRARLGTTLVIAFALGLMVGVMLRGVWVTELLSERGRLRRALKAAEAKARSYASGEHETH